MSNPLAKLTRSTGNFLTSVTEHLRLFLGMTSYEKPGATNECVADSSQTDSLEEVVVTVEETVAVDEVTELEEATIEDAAVVESKLSNNKIGKFQLFKDKRGKWRWRFTVNNGNIIAKSSESYHNYQDAVRSVEIIFQVNVDNVYVETLKDE